VATTISNGVHTSDLTVQPATRAASIRALGDDHEEVDVVRRVCAPAREGPEQRDALGLRDAHDLVDETRKVVVLLC